MPRPANRKPNQPEDSHQGERRPKEQSVFGGPEHPERMRRMGKAITSSPDLQKKVAAQRVDMLTGVLADRFGASTTDQRVQSGLKLWSAVLAATYLDVLDKHGRFDPSVDEESPEYMRNRLNRAFRIVTGRTTRA